MTSDIDLECHQFADYTTLLYKLLIQAKRQRSSTLNYKFYNTGLTYGGLLLILTRPTIRKPQIAPILLDNCIISEVYSHNNLGLTITDKLKWNDHINKIVTKAQNRLNVISRYRLILPHNVLINLYITMVRPVLEYCNMVYNNCTNYLKLLENVQHKAMIF